MAGASVARAGAWSGGAASIDEMVMRPRKSRQACCCVAPAGSPPGLVRALQPREPAPVQLSIVEFGRVLGRLEDLRIVAVENLRVIGFAHQPDALIAALG